MEHLILFAQGNFFLPHGVHACYSSSNFLIEMGTQFLSFRFFLFAHVNYTSAQSQISLGGKCLHLVGRLHCRLNMTSNSILWPIVYEY